MPSTLLDQVRAYIRARHYSIRTERSYVRWIVRFIRFHGLRHPRDLGPPEVAAFLTHLAVAEGVAASTQSATHRRRCCRACGPPASPT